MKIYSPYQLIGYILVLILLLAGCEIDNALEGNGNVTVSRHILSDFDRLEIDGVLDVHLIQGEYSRVEVRTDENLHSIVSVTSEDGTLRIKTSSNNDFEATEMNVYVTAQALNEIKLDGITALYAREQFNQPELYIEKKNTGFMYINTVVQKFTLITDGVGDAVLVGKAQDAIIDNSMTGNIKAYDFITNNLILTHNSTGTAKVNVLANFTLEMIGVGDVYCKTKPAVIDQSGDGLGRLYIDN